MSGVEYQRLCQCYQLHLALIFAVLERPEILWDAPDNGRSNEAICVSFGSNDDREMGPIHESHAVSDLVARNITHAYAAV